MRAWVDGDETQIAGSETHAAGRGTGSLRPCTTCSTTCPRGTDHWSSWRTAPCSHRCLRLPGIPDGVLAAVRRPHNCAWSVLEECQHQDWSKWRLTEWNAGRCRAVTVRDELTRFGLGGSDRLRLARPSGHQRGIGAVGSALPWHGRGQEFESPMLHQDHEERVPNGARFLRVR